MPISHRPRETATILKEVADRLNIEQPEEASELLRSEYPFEPVQTQSRQYSPTQSTQLFLRDGFVDRYSGYRLVFPGALRLISVLLPNDFPYHANWKMSETHIAFWELSPTVDHIVPVSRGCADSEENWVTTSMLRNSAKANWTLDELGWELHEPGNLSDWDGLIRWFVAYGKAHSNVFANSLVKTWHSAAEKALRPV